MKIEIFCVGVARDEGKISQLGGCGVVLVAVDDYGRSQYREFSFGLGGSNQLLAEIQACRLAFSSIIPAMRLHKVILFLESQDVAGLLTSDMTMIGFKDQISELRRWRSYYKDLLVNVHAGSHQRLDRARELAYQGLQTQKNTDSLTVQLSEVVIHA